MEKSLMRENIPNEYGLVELQNKTLNIIGYIDFLTIPLLLSNMSIDGKLSNTINKIPVLWQYNTKLCKIKIY